ncbi:MAG TPA: enoyl-ACP reductase FabI [Candidatus Xenobia bacterium]
MLETEKSVMKRPLEGRKGLIFGVVNDRSIAWGIAQACAAQGAEQGFTYLNADLERRVRPLAESLHAPIITPCDVASDEQVAAVFAEAKARWGKLDFLVHSIAFANKADLERRFSDTDRDGFRVALEISAYSLVLLARHAAPLMTDGGSIVTLTYYGAEKVVANYNVMGVAKAALEASVRYLAADLGPQGIRVNAISAGPIKTLAARGIRGFSDMMHHHAERAPMRRNVDLAEVGGTAAFLFSDAAAGITGEVIHVDGGYHVLGM